MPPADAPGFCKEICRFQRPKSGAVNAKTKSILAFTIFMNSSLLITRRVGILKLRWNRRKPNTGKKIAALLLSVLMAASLCGCTAGGPDLSAAPGGGRWVDSDVKGYVKAQDTTRLQDDFAAAVNRDWIVNGQDSELEYGVESLIINRYYEILDDESITGENARVMRIFRDLACDFDKRNSLGVEPLRKYLEPIENIKTLDDLTAFQGSMSDNPFNLGFIMPQRADQQIQFTEKRTLFLSSPSYSLGSKGAYITFDADALAQKEKTDALIRRVLGRLGYTDSDIKRILKQNYEIESMLARIDNTDGDASVYNLSESLHKVQTTREEAKVSARDYPLLEILDGRGFSECKNLNLDYMYLAALNGVYTGQNLEKMKSFLIVHLVECTKLYLDKPLRNQSLLDEITGSGQAGESDLPSDDYLFKSLIAQGGYLPLMDTLYLDKYFPDDGKTDMYEKLVKDLKQSFRVMISEEEWLSGETREAAMEKLENMVFHVIRPGNTADYSSVDIKSYEEGGNLLDAIAEGKRNITAHLAKVASDENVDRNFWDIYDSTSSTTTVNCFYKPASNCTYILAGWIANADYLFGDDPSYEEMLGCIGTVVGHEISHGFDADGTRFDKTGRVYDDEGQEIDWMSVEDRSRLDERADNLASYFSLARPIPGKGRVNGKLIKNEAVADMAGIKAVLYLLEDVQGFDYDIFFRSYAALWRIQNTEEDEITLMSTDVHPLNFYRININLQQFDKFNETYGIEQGDAMYLAPGRRISVW